MKTIKTFYGSRPILDIVIDFTTKREYGLSRDRYPDAGWAELTNRIMDDAEDTELTPQLKQTLIEDLAYTYGQDSDRFSDKLKEFGLYDFTIDSNTGVNFTEEVVKSMDKIISYLESSDVEVDLNNTDPIGTGEGKSKILNQLYTKDDLEEAFNAARDGLDGEYLWYDFDNYFACNK